MVEKNLLKKNPLKKGSAKKRSGEVSPWDILIASHLSEKSIGLVESENKLVFIVNERVKKSQIKWAVEEAFNVKVEKINMLHDRKNRKKAFVKLKKEYSTLDIATKLGML